MQGKNKELPGRYENDWLSKLDGRTRLAQAARQRMGQLVADLGGADAISYQERSICKRIVWLETMIEHRESQLARGEDIDESRHAANINTLVGLLRSIGLQRRARDVPTLHEYLRQKQREQEQDAAS